MINEPAPVYLAHWAFVHSALSFRL